MKFLSIIFLSLLIAACASVPKHNSSLALINNSDSHYMQREGRFSVIVFDKATHKNIDSVQGNFMWVSNQKYMVLDLNSPLGQTLARIDIHPDYATLTESNGRITKASHPDELIAKVIGQEMPISGLAYWLKGKAIPNILFEHAIYNDQQKLKSFRQLGWDVGLQQYDAVGPKKFDLINDQAMRRINIKIAVY